MQEMVSMGIGSKPFMDIKPSDAAISDRAIDYIMKGSGELPKGICGLWFYVETGTFSVTTAQHTRQHHETYRA